MSVEFISLIFALCNAQALLSRLHLQSCRLPSYWCLQVGAITPSSLRSRPRVKVANAVAKNPTNPLLATNLFRGPLYIQYILASQQINCTQHVPYRSAVLRRVFKERRLPVDIQAEEDHLGQDFGTSMERRQKKSERGENERGTVCLYSILCRGRRKKGTTASRATNSSPAALRLAWL